MQTLIRNQVNRYLTALVLIMIISFLFINFNDTKWTLPILLWALMGVLAAPLIERIPCLLLLVSWVFLWVFAFNSSFQRKHFMLLIFTLLPWTVVVWLSVIYSSRPFNIDNLWFWLPASVFLLSSVLAAHRIFLSYR